VQGEGGEGGEGGSTSGSGSNTAISSVNEGTGEAPPPPAAAVVAAVDGGGDDGEGKGHAPPAPAAVAAAEDVGQGEGGEGDSSSSSSGGSDSGSTSGSGSNTAISLVSDGNESTDNGPVCDIKQRVLCGGSIHYSLRELESWMNDEVVVWFCQHAAELLGMTNVYVAESGLLDHLCTSFDDKRKRKRSPLPSKLK
jgi:hypothetical protein